MQNFRFPSIQFNTVTANIMAICIVLFFADNALFSFGINLGNTLALHNPGSVHFNIFQPITYLFMHGSFEHLLFNMFAFWMFGRVLEHIWGPKRFIIYFLVTGVGAAALHTMVNYIELASVEKAVSAFLNTPSPKGFIALFNEYIPGLNAESEFAGFMSSWRKDPNNIIYIREASSGLRWHITNYIMSTPTVGASGSIFGLLMAYGVLFPNNVIQLLIPPIPIKAKYFVLIYGVIELYLGFSNSSSNIAHFAHLGGMIFGFLLLRYWKMSRKDFY